METPAPTTKAIGFAYPSSPDAKRFGFSKSGCWVVETSRGANPPEALSGHATREAALQAKEIAVDPKRTAEAIRIIAKEVKAGRVEFKLDKNANIAVPVGKFSFTPEQLIENGSAVIDAVVKARPATAKGRFVDNLTISATMTPGVTVDPAPFLKSA